MYPLLLCPLEISRRISERIGISIDLMARRNDESTLQGSSMMATTGTPPQFPSCTICRGQTTKWFSKPLGHTSVDYHLCSDCGHLTAGAIDSLPGYGGEEYFKEIDTGWEGRNKRILEFIGLIVQLPGVALSRRSAILDFGCGSGRLVCDLNRAGFVAYGFEPYLEASESSERMFADWMQVGRTLGQANLITCTEVFEHLRNPDEVVQNISELLGPRGYLLISTDSYKERTHTEDWYYLNPAAGHVSIFSEKSLTMLLRRHQFEPILRISASVWLFRKVGSRHRNLVEHTYFALSQARVKMGVRIDYRKAAEAPSS
jgi:SAM-dependent methyltransferase